MSTQTTCEAPQDTTLTASVNAAPAQSTPKRKRAPRRKNADATRTVSTQKKAGSARGFNVPIGDSGEVFQSVWQFGE